MPPFVSLGLDSKSGQEPCVHECVCSRQLVPGWLVAAGQSQFCTFLPNSVQVLRLLPQISCCRDLHGNQPLTRHGHTQDFCPRGGCEIFTSPPLTLCACRGCMCVMHRCEHEHSFHRDTKSAVASADCRCEQAQAALPTAQAWSSFSALVRCLCSLVHEL